jgi:malonyl CoA-acyl carrier protein transacylase/NAD(P)-dependent dehydrogenase (short-subunit alcohol dehydrogenase family)
VGSVKSLIGHTKCAAGLAGLINASLALYHHVLPPTIGIESPNPRLNLADGPFRLCTQAQPWLHPHDDRPRRAAVSAFGFGGTNFHAVLEAYERNATPEPASALPEWPMELMIWEADRPAGLIGPVDRLIAALESGARPMLCDLSHALIRARAGDGPPAWQGTTRRGQKRAILVIVAGSHEDLRSKLIQARGAIAEGRARFEDPRGIFFAAEPPWAEGRVAFLFPGQGAQAPDMLRELAVAFPEIRRSFEEFDRVVRSRGGPALGPLLFPPPAFDDAGRERARRDLMPTEVAQPAIGAACVGMLRLFRSLGLEPDMVAGHSYGELVALHAAGALDAQGLAELSWERGRSMQSAARGASGAMAAILAGPEAVQPLIREIPGLEAANWNGPRQTVVAGPSEAVNRAVDLASARGLAARRLPVSFAFHTPMVADAREPVARCASDRLRRAPDWPVYSNLDAAPHPSEPSAIARRLGDHLASPVRFADMIAAMHRDGARVFIEVGPGAILGPLVESVLNDRPHLAISCDMPSSSGLSGFLLRLARLVVAGLPLRLERLTAGRSRRQIDLDHLPENGLPDPVTPSTWLVNGSRARPLAGPEPGRLGTGPVLPITERPPETERIPTRRLPGPIPSQQSGHKKPDTRMTPKTPSVPSGLPVHSDHVMESFQKTMQAFLDVQKATMLAYLGGQEPATNGRPVASGGSDVAVAVSNYRPDFGGVDAGPTMVPGNPPNPKVVVSQGPTHAETEANGALHGRNGKPATIAPPSATPPVAMPAAEAPDRASITASLREIVSDRTGYPIDTLGLDLDIEADLGIDSIKRVEILGKLRDEFPSLRNLPDNAEDMDALSRARTLDAIVDRMTALANQAAAPTAPRPVEAPSEAGASPVARTSSEGRVEAACPPLRRVLEVVDAPLPRQRLGLMPGGRILVTEDGQGVAEALSTRLASGGIAVERIGGPHRPVDWTSPSAIDALLEDVRSNGPIAGIVHALPLGLASSGDPDGSCWAERISDAVRGLFLLAKATSAELEHAARAGGSCLIATTALGGRFAGAGSATADFFPGHGGIAGLVKTLAREWPLVRCRVVDLPLGEAVELVAGRLAAEVFAGDGWAEVGYDLGRRIRLRTAESLLGRPDTAVELEPGDPVVITGGARGITALVATELARAWQPRLLIVGTTPPPGVSEPADTAGLESEAEIKAAVHNRLRRDGRACGPAEIESAYQHIRRAREVRENLASLRAAGAEVEYARADVRDPGEMADLLAGWRTRHGNPVGLIHGAGLIKDKLIREKTLDSFDRVLGTKVEGALNLLRLIQPESLKFTALFSSIAGRFGNVGQSDYAAANEILNKLALWLDRRWPGRVVSVIWGPWSGVGMVSQLEGHLGRRGLGMIAPEVGRTLLIDELRRGRKGDVEVIYTGGLGTLEDPLPGPVVPPIPVAEAVI